MTVLCYNILGIKRIFHINDDTDPGFALITGRPRILDQSSVWKLLADIPKQT